MKKDPPKKGQPIKNHPKKSLSPRRQVVWKKYADWMGIALIILLGIIIYSNSFECSFHFDDFGSIVDNPKVKNVSDIKGIWDYYHNRFVAYYSFALNYHFNGVEVWGYHLVNLLIHLVNACLSGWLTLLIFSSPVMKDHPLAGHKKVLALLTALLFVSHPLATQSVTYIVQRLSSMAAMFYLLSIVFYFKARLTAKGETGKYLMFAIAGIAALLALVTKENSYTIPFAIVLSELFFFRTKNVSINLKDYRILLAVAGIIGFILFAVMRFSFSVFKPIPPAQGLTFTVTSMTYLFTQFSVILKYIQLLLVPVNQMVDYDMPIAQSFFELRTALSFLVLAGLVALAVMLFKKYRIISFGIFWFLLTLSIESSIIPIQDLIYEHRTYLPSFGFFLILNSGVFLLVGEKNQWMAKGMLVAIILINAFLTYQRNEVWKNEITLWSDNVKKAPNSARAIHNRGFAYWQLGQYEDAIADYNKAIELNPFYPQAYSNRGVAYGSLNELEKAIADYGKAIALDPYKAQGYYNRGVQYQGLLQWDKAIADYTKAVEVDPNFANGYFNRGFSYSSINQWDKAIADYTRAIEINPAYGQAYSSRGLAYQNISEWDRAIADYSTAIDIDPNFAPSYLNRGVAYGNHQEWDKAIADYSKAIAINPSYVMAYSNRGIAYQNIKDPDKAIADHTQAIAIDPNYASAYYNRGTVYGELRQWDKAIADYTSVITLRPNFKEAYVNRGMAYGNAGQPEKAISDYNSALAIDPNFAIALSNRDIAMRNFNAVPGKG